MSSIKPRERLYHILNETKFLESISTKIENPTQLKNDEILRRSVERSIEIIGEAVKDIPPSIQQLSPSIEWGKIARMRDNLIHRYFAVESHILFEVVKKHAPLLKKDIGKILNKLNKDEYVKYRNQITSKQTKNLGYFSKINEQTKIDVAIAKLILKEYPQKFSDIAIEKVKSVIGVGERASELATNNEKTTPEQYLKEIIASSQQSNQQKSPRELE